MLRIYQACLIAILALHIGCDSQASQSKANTEKHDSALLSGNIDTQQGSATKTNAAEDCCSTDTMSHSGSKQNNLGSDSLPQTKGTVLETMNSGGYTYVLVRTQNAEVWAAVPESKIETGQRVTIPGGMVMKNFRSETLGRDFAEILFASAILIDSQTEQQNDADPGLPPSHPVIAPAKLSDGEEIDLSNIEKATDGYRVEEIFNLREQLTSKEITVRGKVVKYTPRVMGKNWLHLRDGSGQDGSNDLVVTTQMEAALGDLIEVRGTIVTNKDFGFGYKYDVLLEDAVLVQDQ